MRRFGTPLLLAMTACTPDPPCVPFEGTLQLPGDVQAPVGDVTVGLFPVDFGAWAFCLPDQL